MTDWIANGESGSAVRGKLNAVTNKGNSEEITSGAAPVVCAADKNLTLVTSGGTHGDEIVELDDLVFTLDGFARPEQYGLRHVIVLKTLTANDDVVKVRLNSGSTINIKDKKGNILAVVENDAVVLDYEGATAVFEWAGEGWILNHEDNNTSTTFTDVVPIVPAPSASGKDEFLNSFNGNLGWAASPAPGTLHTVSTGASPTAVAHDQYTTALRSGATGGTEIFSIAEVQFRSIGTRHVFVADEINDPADVLSLDVTNVKALDGSSVSSVTMDTEGQYILLEAWTPTEWRILRGTAVVT